VSSAFVIFLDSDSYGHPAERVADMSRDLKLQKNETSGALRKLAQVESRLANSQSG
jgi:hypothetical protein